MRLLQRVGLVCAAMLLPVATATAQLRLSGSGVLDPVQSPFTAFTAGAVQYEFLLPQPPRGEAFPPDAFALSSILGNFSQGERTLSVLGELLFYTADAGGGFVFGPLNGTTIINASGDQLFTRTVTAPLFRTGTFSVTDFPGAPGVISVQGSVTIAPATTVPEPATLLLVATGLAGFAIARSMQRQRVRPG